jgi:hypothetical protein
MIFNINQIGGVLMQEKQTEANRLAWNTKAYDAWMKELGTPTAQADKLRNEPKYPLR